MSIVKTVDSEFPPSTATLVAAKADGVIGWNGYLPGQNIAHGWSAADFAAVRAVGLYSIAYASGWSDPATAKAQAALYGVRGCLDVEGGIRGDGPWVQGWLDVSGFGLYGNAPVHQGRTAAFHVLAAYPGHDPGASWPKPRPLVPAGWQWAGSVTKYGTSVDLCWFDQAIYITPSPDPTDPPIAGDPRMFIWYRNNGGIFLCNMVTCTEFGDGADVTYYLGLGFPAAHENRVTAAWAAKINALPEL